MRTCRTSASSVRRSAACFDINDFDETLPGHGNGRQASRPASRSCDRASPLLTGVRCDAGVRESGPMSHSAALGTLGAWYDQLDAGMLLRSPNRRPSRNA
jgi:hypothetical protein